MKKRKQSAAQPRKQIDRLKEQLRCSRLAELHLKQQLEIVRNQKVSLEEKLMLLSNQTIAMMQYLEKSK